MNFIANSLFSIGVCLIIIGSMDKVPKEKPPVIKYVPVVQSFNDSQVGLSMTSLTEEFKDMFDIREHNTDESHNLRGKFT